ncbi:MAG: SRPBCC family protein [Chloroflexota bacterium]|nr:SRPBCC family protein [Chloroflexota bacterium]
MAKKRKPRAVVENRILVTASPEVLWTCFADLGKWPHWFPALLEAAWVSGIPWTLGAQFRQVVKFGFPLGQVSGIATITEISAIPYVVWEGKVMGMEAIHSFHFDATLGGTEVLSRHEFYGHRALLARIFFLTRRVHKIYQATLEGLKAYVEVGKIQLKMLM